MPRSMKQMASNFCVRGTSHMLGLGLGCKTIFFATVPLPLLLTSYLAFMPPRDCQSQNGSRKIEETASSVTLCLSDAFAIYPHTSASALALPPHSLTVSNATRSPPTTTKMTALCGRCIVPSWHPCAGKFCPTSFQDYSYAMRCVEFDADIEDNMAE